MKKAIIIGASSGIGRELALKLAENQYQVCVTARRVELLETLIPNLTPGSILKKMDLVNLEDTQKVFSEIIEEFGRIDLIIISAGVGFINHDLEWSKEVFTISVNVSGFTLIAGLSCNQFIEQGFGHIVGISSIAALRGGGSAPAYNASKSYVANYLQGLRQKCSKVNKNIRITDIRPGFVDTDMAQGDGLFWVQPVEKACNQIFRAIKKKRKVAYITKRWRLIGWLIRLLPDAFYNKM